MLIAAFIAACGEQNKSKVRLGKNHNNQKTLQQLDKSSSDESIKKLVDNLIKKSDLQIPDIITAVNREFGNSSVGKVLKDKDSLEVELLDVGTDNKLAQQQELVQELDIDVNASVDKVVTQNRSNVEEKVVCVGVCDIQIRVHRVLDKNKELKAIKAYVLVQLTDENAKVSTSRLKNKELKRILGIYDTSSKEMNLKLEFAQKNGNGNLELIANKYHYSENYFDKISFVNSENGDSGEIVLNNGKFLMVNFYIDNDSVSIKLINDYGLFGRNQTEEPTIAPDSSDDSDKSSSQKTGTLI